MNARDARRITDKSLKTHVTADQVRVLGDAIAEAAEKGKDSVDPWSALGSAGKYPQGSEKEAIESHFRGEGFKITDHPNPDPGHPASRAYTTLSW